MRNKSLKPKEKKSFGRKLLSVIKVLFIIGLLFLAFVAVVNIVMVVSTKDRVISADDVEENGYDCIIVLGAGVRDDGSPSYMLEDRLKTGISLLEDGAASVILMSGDHGREDYDEVNTMKSFAVAAGVDEDVVFLDHAGFSTYDSMYRARDVFGAKKVLIVTQKYHLYRALYIAESLGLEADGVSADLRSYRGQVVHDAREALARTKAMLFTWFKPEPVCLGEPIDLSGSASQTNG